MHKPSLLSDHKTETFAQSILVLVCLCIVITYKFLHEQKIFVHSSLRVTKTVLFTNVTTEQKGREKPRGGGRTSTAGTMSMPTVRNSSNFRKGLKQLPTSRRRILPS